MLDFPAIRKLYKSIDPREYNPYPIDWLPIFTPIENRAWDAIRHLGLPIWPQYPIGKYFADFADPIKKIVIECDGAAYHSLELDAKRDAWMISQGWSVFRINGADCNRIILPPWEQVELGIIERRSEEYEDALKEWASRTIDGLVSAIWRVYYRYGKPEEFAMAVIGERKANGRINA